ncbi:uncharacterized protein LOC134226325 [Armigeres subalbatus]|uniref:uncharacterized protein LOC134226325 n=1 Tax=Armigeres subalbatus TaxID=124917 RepID=UPI002ED42B99
MHFSSLANSLLLKWFLVLHSLIPQVYLQHPDEEYFSCRGGGICVPPYLCKNGTVITNGDGLIDTRLSENNCPADLVCCRDASTGSQDVDCNATCVELYQCLDDVFDSGLRAIGSSEKFSCPDNKICCNRVRPVESISEGAPLHKCTGKCVPIDQCDKGKSNITGIDLIDLRFSGGECNQPAFVCCMDSQIIVPQFGNANVCNGKCVSIHECMNTTTDGAGYNEIDLRINNVGSCTGDLVCCSDATKSKFECQGMCMPISQCGKDLIDLRYSNEGCERADFVCCLERITPSPPSQSVCNGMCVPMSQCPDYAGNGIIDLRISDKACPINTICCTTEFKPDSLQCTCSPIHQCLDDITVNTSGGDLLDLRGHVGECPSEQICCKNIKPSGHEMMIPPASRACQGMCVPFNNCPGDASSNYHGCADSFVCCNSIQSDIPSHQMCEGECVPPEECPGESTNPFGLGLINLRKRSHNTCMDNLVCCVNRLVTPIVVPDDVQSAYTCEASCVPSYQCNTPHTNIIDLRAHGNCPGDLVCCESTVLVPQTPTYTDGIQQVGTSCVGYCVPLVQCADPPVTMMMHLIDLRFRSSQSSCSDGLICCGNPIRKSPEEEKWLHWIEDMNNLVDLPNQEEKKSGQCQLSIDRSTNRIQPNGIPWLVSIWESLQYQQERRKKYICTGILLRADVVLVSADCVQDVPKDRLLVRVGNSNLKSKTGFQEYPVIREVIHPDFNMPMNSNNIALLFLQDHNGMKHPTACVFGINENVYGLDCIVAGWDMLEVLVPSSSSIVPKKHHLSIIQLSSCSSHELCTGKNHHTKDCNKLQGSAVICNDQYRQSWKIAGIVAKNNQLCDMSGIPERLVGIPPLMPWIEEQLSPSFVQKPADLGPLRKYLPAT